MLETVQNFTYLDSKIKSDRRSYKDTLCRIVQVKHVNYRNRNLYTLNTVSLDTKKSLINNFVLNVALFREYTRNIVKAVQIKIEVSEVWCWQKC